MAPSVIETNAISFTAQQEWETEWNQQGLASRLSPEVHAVLYLKTVTCVPISDFTYKEIGAVYKMYLMK